MLVDAHFVLTKCTTWPQKHTTWSTTGYTYTHTYIYEASFLYFSFFVTYHPHESLSAFLKSCQNLNAVCPCYIPLFSGTVLIFLSVLMTWLFSFSLFFFFFFSSFCKITLNTVHYLWNKTSKRLCLKLHLWDFVLYCRTCSSVFLIIAARTTRWRLS